MPHTDWLLTKSERANALTRVDDLHPGNVAWSEGNLVRPLVHGATYFAELLRATRWRPRRPGALHRLARRPRRAAGREPGTEVVRRAVPTRPRAACDVKGLVWRSHLDQLSLQRAGEPPPGRGDRGGRRRVPARHAGAPRRLAPPEVRRAAAPGTARARRRVRRRHRPVPQPPRRRRAPRRPADAADGEGVRRPPAVARRPARDPRAGRRRRRGHLPRALGRPARR